MVTVIGEDDEMSRSDIAVVAVVAVGIIVVLLAVITVLIVLLRKKTAEAKNYLLLIPYSSNRQSK